MDEVGQKFALVEECNLLINDNSVWESERQAQLVYGMERLITMSLHFKNIKHFLYNFESVAMQETKFSEAIRSRGSGNGWHVQSWPK